MSYVRNNIMSEIATPNTIYDNPSSLTNVLGKNRPVSFISKMA